jgi:hypothetical protein
MLSTSEEFREVDMTKTKLWAYVAGALAPALLAIAGPVAAANLNFVPTTAISLPSGTAPLARFDISFVDPTIALYFLADRSNKAIDVVQTSNNQLQVLLTASPPFAGATPSNDNAGPDGTLTVRHQETWNGDGPSQVKVINLFNRQTTHVIPTGGANRADELCLDSRHGVVLMANDAESPFPFVSFISTTTYTVTGRITMDGTINGGSVLPTPKATNGIEQCQWDGQGAGATGHFFINIPEVNGPGNDSQPGAVLEIDPVTHAIVNQYNIPLASCAGPQGMAIGPDPQILLGCNATANANNPTAIINKHNGSIVATINQQSGSDEVWFNPGDGLYFLARSGAVGATQLLGIIDSVTFASNSVFTANKNVPGNTAHSVAADPSLNQVYVPIPAGVSTICGSLGGSNANGCIAVFTAQ